MAAHFRRWGRLLVSPFVGAAVLYNRTAKSHPVATGVITSGLKTSAADLFAQKFLEKKEQIDWKRNTVFSLFGYAYLGGFQYWLYNVKFVQWCEPIRKLVGHAGVAPLKTALDQCIHHPFIYFPAFYVIKASVEGQPASYALEKWISEIEENVKALWTIWVPAQIVNFAFVPRHLRIPYVAGVSFVWTVVLSVMQGEFDTAMHKKPLRNETVDEPVNELPHVMIAKVAEGPAIVDESEEV